MNMIEITEKEEKVMFHTLGYEYQPRWNDDKGGYRNWFGIYPSEDNGDYIAIKSLVEKGYMQKDGVTAWKEETVTTKELVRRVIEWQNKNRNKRY